MKYMKKYKDILESNQVGLTIYQIVDGLKNGSIKISSKKHNLVTFDHNQSKADDYFKKEIIERLESAIERYEKSAKTHEKESFREYCKILLERPYEYGEYIDAGGVVSVNCWDCGGSGELYVILTYANTLSFMSSKEYWDNAEKTPKKYEYRPKESDINDCELSKFNITDKMVAEIDVPTGDLIVTNFFKKKELYEEKTEKYRSINSIIGRYSLMQELASRNVGYGQMGNMSVDVYKKDDGTEIIIGDAYGYDEERGEFEYEFDGFTKLGHISLSVWRWMCADKKVLDDHNEVIPDDLTPDSETEMDYKDYVWVKVKPGKWVIEHYYDIQGDRKDGIYSKLYLK